MARPTAGIRRADTRCLLHSVDGLGEQDHARAQRLGKALLLLQQHARGVIATLLQFGVGLTHLLAQRRHELVEERTVDAEFVTVTNRATDDPPQHVAAALVGGQHPVNDEKGTGADVIRNHPQRRVGQIVRSCQARRRRHDAAEQIDVVVVGHALHDRRNTLETRTRVDRGLRQRRQRAIGRALELHEHEVPDLDVTIAVFVW